MGNNTGVNTKVNTEVNTEVNPEVNTEVNTEMNTEMNPEMNTEVNPEVNTEVNPEVNTEVNPELDNLINNLSKSYYKEELKKRNENVVYNRFLFFNRISKFKKIYELLIRADYDTDLIKSKKFNLITTTFSTIIFLSIINLRLFGRGMKMGVKFI